LSIERSSTPRKKFPRSNERDKEISIHYPSGSAAKHGTARLTLPIPYKLSWRIASTAILMKIAYSKHDRVGHTVTAGATFRPRQLHTLEQSPEHEKRLGRIQTS